MIEALSHVILFSAAGFPFRSTTVTVISAPAGLTKENSKNKPNNSFHDIFFINLLETIFTIFIIVLPFFLFHPL
jgi:hypothetical protein